MNPQPEPFAALRIALEAAGIRFAIGGSWASMTFGEPRFTNDVDVIADLSLPAVDRFIAALPTTFYADAADARTAVMTGRSFNVIHVPSLLKFDLFPARAFPLGMAELDRAIFVPGTGLSDDPVPFVTPEDILLAKLHWYRRGGEISSVQWRDISGIVNACAATLDRAYLERSAAKIGVTDLLARALEHADR